MQKPPKLWPSTLHFSTPSSVRIGLGVPNDRVGPEVGQVLGLLAGRHVRKRPDRSRAARAALVEEQQPVVLERALPPGVVDQLEQARRLEPGAALEVDQPRQVVVLARRSDDLAREDGDRRAARLRVVERQLELVLGEDEVRRAVAGDSHPAILICRGALRRSSRRYGASASACASRSASSAPRAESRPASRIVSGRRP